MKLIDVTNVALSIKENLKFEIENNKNVDNAQSIEDFALTIDDESLNTLFKKYFKFVNIEIDTLNFKNKVIIRD